MIPDDSRILVSSMGLQLLGAGRHIPAEFVVVTHPFLDRSESWCGEFPWPNHAQPCPTMPNHGQPLATNPSYQRGNSPTSCHGDSRKVVPAGTFAGIPCAGFDGSPRKALSIAAGKLVARFFGVDHRIITPSAFTALNQNKINVQTPMINCLWPLVSNIF